MNRECDVPHMAGARPARLGVRGLRQSVLCAAWSHGDKSSLCP